MEGHGQGGIDTPTQQEKWVNKQFKLWNTNSGRRWFKKSDGFRPGALVRAECKLSGVIKGGEKQITIKKSDLKLIQEQAYRANQLPVLVAGFRYDDFEEQLVIMPWQDFFRLFKKAEGEE